MLFVRLARAEEVNQRLREDLKNKLATPTANGHNNDAELVDIKFKYQRLQTQYDYMASKAATQGNSQKDADDQIDVINLI